jgi:hypothetical protein
LNTAKRPRQRPPLWQFHPDYIPTPQDIAEQERRSRESDEALHERTAEINAATECADKSGRILSETDKERIRNSLSGAKAIRKARDALIAQGKAPLNSPPVFRPRSGYEALKDAEERAARAALLRAFKKTEAARAHAALGGKKRGFPASLKSSCESIARELIARTKESRPTYRNLAKKVRKRLAGDPEKGLPSEEMIRKHLASKKLLGK